MQESDNSKFLIFLDIIFLWKDLIDKLHKKII